MFSVQVGSKPAGAGGAAGAVSNSSSSSRDSGQKQQSAVSSSSSQQALEGRGQVGSSPPCRCSRRCRAVWAGTRCRTRERTARAPCRGRGRSTRPPAAQGSVRGIHLDTSSKLAGCQRLSQGPCSSLFVLCLSVGWWCWWQSDEKGRAADQTPPGLCKKPPLDLP